jgi:hypothetical protein
MNNPGQAKVARILVSNVQFSSQALHPLLLSAILLVLIILEVNHNNPSTASKLTMAENIAAPGADQISRQHDMSDALKETAINPPLVPPQGPGPDGEQDDFHNEDQDRLDMQRLGKKQQFKRTFSLWSSIGFVAIYMATWEFVLISLSPGFTNGGYAGVFWCFITTTTAYSAVVASLAEMASMAPTSGGQYRE